MTRQADEYLVGLQRSLVPLRQQVVDHRVYQSINTIEALRLFMEHHVFAVWDFMSLLKALQQELTCINVPWMPSPDPFGRRLVNEIVLGEESDQTDRGGYLSHFEMYHQAMKQAGADTTTIDLFLKHLGEGAATSEALVAAKVPPSVRHFVTTTFDIIQSAKPWAIGAAFTFGREEVIPDMFRRMVDELHRHRHGQLDQFLYYLERHIELDGDHHGPLATRMLTGLCGEDEGRWRTAQQAAVHALTARRMLWDAVVQTTARITEAQIHRPTRPSP